MQLGFLTKLLGYARRSGPGWVQAAVTLGGGTLVSALYLGVIGGYEFLWLQPVAMLCGIIMLGALSYITLSVSSSADRPFVLARKHVSPVLAWGWLVASVIANIVFCSSQFALGADAIQGNLGGQSLNPFFISGILFFISLFLIWLFSQGGKASAVIDHIIKGVVALIVLSFFAVAATLMLQGAVDWSRMFSGLIPDFSSLFKPAAAYSSYISATGDFAPFWNDYISSNQRDIVIGAFGTAVGINMTFLLPYSIMKRNWGRKDRELAVYDLVLGLLIPFMLASSGLIIATASQFHAQAQARVSEGAYHEVLDARLAVEFPGYSGMAMASQEELRASASIADRNLSTMLAKRNANDLAGALSPFLGNWSQLIFGIGVLAMALSTMLVHMMINGYAISEAFGHPGKKDLFMIGASIPALLGLFSPLWWNGVVKSSLVVPASVIATTFLPIAYLTFILLMNSKKALVSNVPARLAIINVLMVLAASIATFASVWALIGKYQSQNNYEKGLAIFGLVLLPMLIFLGIKGFWKREEKNV